MEHLTELKFLGQSVEWSDYAQYEYKGFYISLHLTITGNTRVRLQKNIHDEIFYSCLCDWCTGGMNHVSEGIISDLHIVDSVALMLWSIDNDCVAGLPDGSNIRPIWNDPVFHGWFRQEMERVPVTYCTSVANRLVSDVDRQEFLHTLVREKIRKTIPLSSKGNLS